MLLFLGLDFDIDILEEQINPHVSITIPDDYIHETQMDQTQLVHPEIDIHQAFKHLKHA